MEDRQLYEEILGIRSPWYVDRVELKRTEQEVHVYLRHEEVRWPCPECQRPCSLYDHQPERVWRHLDTCQYRTLLHAESPRTHCPQHGSRVVRLPWAEPGSRFTLLFERLAIDWLKAGSQKAVAVLLDLSWDEIHNIMERAVARGLRRRQAEDLPQVGVDEKSFKRGHRYLTIVNDLKRSRVLFVAQDRKQTSLDEFWPTLTQEQRNSIQAIATDMWDPYLASIREHLPDADRKIVLDKFHIARHLAQAVDQVRRQESKELAKKGDPRLIGTKYDWLRHPAHFSREASRRFRNLRESELRTARAWALKESAMLLFDYKYEGAARRFFRWWFNWATHSRLKPMARVAKMLKSRLDNVLTYLRHRITNAVSEALNAKIQWLKYTARGFRNQTNFITAIYFHCAGLDLTPGLPT